MLHQRHTQSQRGGFTLVELLIVIVVIAILAAISVVAYQGVASNAQAAALKANLSQAATKLETYKVDNGVYPPDQATVASLLKLDPSVSLTYAASNATGSPAYCLVATQGSQQFSVSSTATTPAANACVINLATDPRATTVFSAPGVWGGFVPTWWGGGTNAGTINVISGAADGPEVSPGVRIQSYLRRTWTVVAAGPSGPQEVAYTHYTTADGVAAAACAYTVSSFVRFSKGWTVNDSSGRVRYIAQVFDGNHVQIGSYLAGPLLDPPLVQSGVWYRPNATFILPTGTVYAKFSLSVYIGTNAWAPGDTLDGTGLMITKGSTLYNYADGNSPGWSWTGTPNASASFGPPL